MNRTIANVIIDLAAALLFVGMIATGYVLRFPLPPGTNRTLILWNLTRHQWGAIHFWISLSLLTVIAIHLALHWKWVVTVIGKRLRLVTKPRPSMARSAMIVVSTFVFVFGCFALAVNYGVKEMAVPLHSLAPNTASALDETRRPNIQAVKITGREVTWDDVYHVLMQRCVSCHGPQRQLGGFRADQAAAYRGGSNQPPLVVPGKSAESRLIAIVSGTSSDVPALECHRLPDKEIALLRDWIDGGAGGDRNHR